MSEKAFNLVGLRVTNEVVVTRFVARNQWGTVVSARSKAVVGKGNNEFRESLVFNVANNG